ncbi:OB-fold domain-containing protein [Sporosarcina sp. Marseille-Q4063]|uniref:Zn-ribbon domain-containing OB-fold protein n=1 Tax=Sporosarcina sp. Marseille-Q4063 TaxID=2810514 RepID=UPI001BB0CD02|nr:OB-fold domain-containing protein [Sporosarcina sp. Marseille-Q4063]QUW21290.1 OB-fold domain-containing protein [Sporosarcina sp. Marseille-Q4063]
MAAIQVYECNQCEQKFVQRKWICPNCKGIEFHIREVNGKGKVFSHTTIHVSSKEFSGLTPYTIVLVDFEEGFRVTGRVGEKVEINDEVRCVSYENQVYSFVKV